MNVRQKMDAVIMSELTRRGYFHVDVTTDTSWTTTENANLLTRINIQT